ncbi:amiloride-sensitive cation channel 5-like protein [Sarcoptes scabiei]|uniref:Amiloride-sensitive cation channel 5-like protein n=1 Tax=Sarcoptes scabiei TaxID=52283 RepID=A0A131ZWH2_SARSC|nr:amiloride-sensitive cation channel 5-like protein [Sarcoptes scabiei]
MSAATKLFFAGFLYQATDICAHYFSYRTVVYTNTEQDSLVDLPSITFCLPTYFTKQSVEELYAPYIKRNLEEMAAFKNQSMLDAIKPVIYETFQKQAFKDLSASEILERSISNDGVIECRLFYPPQHWPNLTREKMYEIVQYGLPCEEVTQVISSINANGKCFTFFSQLFTDNESLKAFQNQHGHELHQMMEYQQYPQMTSFASSSASSASTRSTGPVAPPIVQHSRYVPVSHKISVNHGYRFHSGRFIRLQVQFNRNQYTVISDGHQRECLQVHPPFKIPSEACIHTLNPGMSYDFMLTKTKAILQPPPYQTNCQSYQAVTQAESQLLASTSDPSELKEFYLKPMSRSDCIDKCMINIYEKYCGCLPIHISIWERSSLFLNMSVCDYEDFERISPCLEKELSSACYDTCKSDCIDRHYHVHVESRVYPSMEQIKQATGVERLRLKQLRQNAATISIWSNYLSDITYVHTPAMSLIQLICYLGGLAGLWLGVSVMTVSGWVAQLYPFMQKWNYKQRYILLTARQNLKYLYESFRRRRRYSRRESLLPDYEKTSDKGDCCYASIDDNDHDHSSAVARRAVYWSNYSSMSTSSNDLSLISSSTNSTNLSDNGGSSSSSNGSSSKATTVLRRLSLINTPVISNLSKYSYRV